MLCFLRSFLRLLWIPVVLLLGVACNELPTETGSELIPGTDTVYTVTSDSVGILTGASSVAKREPFINNTYVLFGKTSTSEARIFMQVTTFPNFGAGTDFTVDTAQLEIIPQVYAIGDTSQREFSAVGYEITQPWSANVTWDSVWTTPDGITTSYYNTSTRVLQSSAPLPANDSLMLVPVDNAMIHRWLVLNADSATRNQVFGMALLPQTGNVIRQYRNLNGSTQTMRIRVVYNHKDSSTLDTAYLSSVVACFVNTPQAPSTDLLVEGARQHYFTVDVDLNTLPTTALLLNSSLRISYTPDNSVLGYGGIDEILTVTYTTKAALPYTLRTRYDATTGTYTFSNIAPLLQQLRKDGGVGQLIVRSDDQSGNRFWKMNRLYFQPLTASIDLRPKLSIVYALPTTLK